MSAERPIPEDFVELNQEHWRKAKRGVGSRPIELPRTGELINSRIQSTFSEYGIGEVTKPIFTVAVLTDNPKTSSSTFVHEERYPEEIAEADKQNYAIGISRINEYATNYATKEFFKKNADVPVLKQAASLYGEISDMATYGILLAGTFSRMRTVEVMAKHNHKDYKHALLTSLFEHDTSELDEIINMGSDYYGYSNLNQMAVEVGKKRLKKPDIGKWFDKLDANREDGKVKKAIKNGVLSTAALGVYRNPGIIETHAAIIPAAPIIASAGTFGLLETGTLAAFPLDALIHPNHIGIVLENIPELVPEPAAAMAATALLISPFVAVHEAIHHYSADESHLGLIPTKLIQKEVTPYKARLETPEQK